MKKITAITALVAAILAVGGYAGAAIVSNGVVNACYYTGTGNIRVDGDGICPSGQKPIKLAQGGVTPTELLTWKPTPADAVTDRVFPVGTKISAKFQQYGGAACTITVKAGTQTLKTIFTGDDNFTSGPTVTLTDASPLSIEDDCEDAWNSLNIKVTVTEPQGVLS